MAARGPMQSDSPFIHEDVRGNAQFPTVHVVSDSVGETARTMAQAAAAQFGVTNPKIEILGKVKSFEQVRDYLDHHAAYHVEHLGDDRLLVFYTLVAPDLRDAVSAYIAEHENIYGVDLLTSAITAMADISGLSPISTTSIAWRHWNSPSSMTTVGIPKTSPRLTSWSSESLAPPRRRYASTWPNMASMWPMSPSM